MKERSVFNQCFGITDKIVGFRDETWRPSNQPIQSLKTLSANIETFFSAFLEILTTVLIPR